MAGNTFFSSTRTLQQKIIEKSFMNITAKILENVVGCHYIFVQTHTIYNLKNVMETMVFGRL